MRASSSTLLLAASLGLLLSGCELIVDFDRSRIGADAGMDAGPDAGDEPDSAVDPDAAVPDGG